MKIMILIVLLVLGACCGNKNIARKAEQFTLYDTYKGYNIIQKSDIVVLTHIKEVTPKFPEKILEVVIFDTKKETEILKEQYKNGLLEWMNDSVLKISYTPGNPEKGKEYFFFYNLSSKTKYQKEILLK